MSGGLNRELSSAGTNSLIYVIGQAMSRIVGFVMVPVYTRFFAPSDYGVMELIEIVVSVVAIITSFGISEGLSRFYYGAKEEDRNGVVSTVLVGISIIGLPLIGVFAILSPNFSKIIFQTDQYSSYFAIAICTSWFSIVCDIGFSYLRMLYKAKQFVITTTLQLITALSFNIFFVVVCRFGILGVFYSAFIVQSFLAVYFLVTILKSTGFRMSRALLWEVVAFGAPLVPSRIGVLVGFLSNRFFLRWLSSGDPASSLTLVGLFSLGHKFGVVVNRLVNAPFNSYWVPRRIDLLMAERDDSKEIVARMCTYALALSLFFSLLLSAGIEMVIRFIADPAYIGSSVVVPFVALSYVFLGMEVHFSTGIIYRKKTKWASYITFISVPIIIVWNFLFIPKWGIVGAATSNLAGGLFRVVVLYIVSQNLFYLPFELVRMMKLFLSAFLLYSFSQLVSLENDFVCLLARLSVASLLPFMLLLVRFYTSDEKENIGNFAKKYFPNFC